MAGVCYIASPWKSCVSYAGKSILRTSRHLRGLRSWEGVGTMGRWRSTPIERHPLDRNDPLVQEFLQALKDCRRLYRNSAQLIVQRYPDLAWREPDSLIELMDDLHAGLLIKTHFQVTLADRRWSSRERWLTQLLIEHVWTRRLEGDELRDAARRLADKAQSLSWYSLVRPFAEVAPLREYVASVEAAVIRVANIVAKIDGNACESEKRVLRSIQLELETHLRPLSLEPDEQPTGPVSTPARRHSTDQSFDSTGWSEDAKRTVEAFELRQAPLAKVSSDSDAAVKPEGHNSDQSLTRELNDLFAELHSLIGLQRVKEEVQTLANVLRMQQQRRARGLPATEVSLHMIFTGNPGTGKTTVARLVTRLLAAMGILRRGHLVETDRSGLVAEYAGQTGPKTNERIDKALDGVLFVDEAYSLVADGEDPYGHEALQALLKRMEDDRDRLVVILAGYPKPMKDLLTANPGLSSRFNRHLEFDDYQPVELAQIFSRLCAENHFELTGDVRGHLLLAFYWLYKNRDEHFGNGRTARNLFETSVRRMANRIAGSTDISHQLLTQFHASDFEFPGVPDTILAELARKARYQVECPGCGHEWRVTAEFLRRSVQCIECRRDIEFEWGQPVMD